MKDKKIIEILAVIAIYIFCLIAIVELGINYFSFKFLFPIKNSTSYGYVVKKTGKTIIELNKYNSRTKAQLALPYELLIAYINNKNLILNYNNKTKKYGFVDKNGKVVIKHKYVDAQKFVNDYAVVAIEINKEKKYGTIDINGEWIIEPKYDYLCPFSKYYTRACIDDGHCGIIDRYGNQATLMTYSIENLECKDKDCGIKLCTIGKDKKEISCNYFL